MIFRFKAEPSARAWALRFALGPASMLDGLAHLATAGCLVLGLSLNVARQLTRERMAVPFPSCGDA